MVCFVTYETWVERMVHAETKRKEVGSALLSSWGGDGGRRSGGFSQGRSGEPKRKGWGGVLARQIVVEAWRCGSRWL